MKEERIANVMMGLFCYAIVSFGLYQNWWTIQQFWCSFWISLAVYYLSQESKYKE